MQVGRRLLYLLDSNDAENSPAEREITSELYGGGPELRLQQEIILGIGGWRLLGWLGIKPEVCHLNEGHAALAVLERAARFMAETKQSFEVALAVTRTGEFNADRTGALLTGRPEDLASALQQLERGAEAITCALTLEEQAALLHDRSSSLPLDDRAKRISLAPQERRQ